MKKIFVILFCVVLLTSVAFAEFHPAKTMSKEEMYEIYSAIGAELWGEKMASEDGAKILYGKYVVGTDIPEGSYVIATEDDVSGNDQTFVAVYENDDDKSKRIGLDAIGNGCAEIQLYDMKAGNVIYISTYTSKLNLRIYTFFAYMNKPE